MAGGSEAIARGDLRIGTLTADPGGLLDGAPLITGATVVFALGESPIHIDEGGAAGGRLVPKWWAPSD